jgi:hypothetical protein
VENSLAQGNCHLALIEAKIITKQQFKNKKPTEVEGCLDLKLK